MPTRIQREAAAKRRAASRRATLARHGITQEDYDRQLAKQGGCCAICRSPHGKTNFAFDHDHDHCQRGCKVCWRGLLCKKCNLHLLGWICRESSKGKDHAVEILEGAIRYIKSGGCV